jgi:hypothetical protein
MAFGGVHWPMDVRAAVRSAVALASFAVMVPAALAQTVSFDFDRKRYPTGHVMPTPEQVARFPAASLTRAYIPEAIDLSERFPRPQQQVHGSCVAWAVGYAARSYYSRYEAGKAQYEASIIPSPAYIYNRTYMRDKGEKCQDAGSSIAAALILLNEEGSASLADYGVEATCDPARAPSGSPGKSFRIKTALNIAVLPNRPLDPQIAKQVLALGHPVVVGIRIDAQFVSLRPAEVYAGMPALTFEQLKEAPGHAVVLVGYDERRDAFRVFNSWSTNWADGGYGWVSSKALRNQVTDAWLMVAPVEPPRPASGRPYSPTASAPKGVQDLISEAACSDVQMSQKKDTLDQRDDVGSTGRLTGFVSRARDFERIKQRLETSGMINEVALRPWPICEAMLTLREPMRAASRPKVELAGGNRALKVGETFAFKVTPPDVPAFLYVLYIEDDGTVVNLAPRTGPMRRQVQPKEGPLLFGDGKDSRPTFRVTPLKSTDELGKPRAKGDPERGHEAVIAIASRAPIEELEALEGADSKVYRVAAKSQPGDGPPDRLLLTVLKDIVHKRAKADALPREVSADVLHVRIED